MADDIQINIDTTQFEAKLKALPTAVANRYLRNALQAAGDVVLAPMKELAPERTDEQTPDDNSLPPGILRQDLSTQVTLSENGAKVKIGPTAVAGHVCRWQNNGWMLTSHDGKKIRQIPGKHFMEAAFDEAGQAAIEALVQSLSDSLNTESAESDETLESGGTEHVDREETI
jgi:Bacteriophage HK97-gp10, putative tail-component